MWSGVFLLTVAWLFGFGHAKVAPDFITPCPGMKSQCLKRTVQKIIPLFVKGIPSLNLTSLDPLYQDKVVLTFPGGLDVAFNNGTVTGLRDCIVDSVSYDNVEAEFNFHCNLIIRGQYTASGQILIFAVNGNGESQINTTNILLKSKVTFEDKVRNDIIYREVKDFTLDYDYAGGVSFNITNLINGYPTLSDTVLSFINTHWKIVTYQLGKPIVDTIVNIVIENIKKFFSSVPRDELIVN